MKNQSAFLEELTKNTLAKNRDLQNQIKPAGTLSQEEALWVYQEGYFSRLHESLSENYQATHKYLGVEKFQTLAFEYILSHPSHEYQINQYGFDFPEFLKNSGLLDAYELSDFEKKWTQLFHAKEELGLSAEEIIKAFDGDSPHLTLVSSCRLYQSNYTVYECWKDRSNEKVTLSSHRAYGVLYKKEGKVFHRYLHPLEYQALDQLKNSKLLELIESLDFDEKSLQDFFIFLGHSRILK